MLHFPHSGGAPVLHERGSAMLHFRKLILHFPQTHLHCPATQFPPSVSESSAADYNAVHHCSTEQKKWRQSAKKCIQTERKRSLHNKTKSKLNLKCSKTVILACVLVWAIIGQRVYELGRRWQLWQWLWHWWWWWFGGSCGIGASGGGIGGGGVGGLVAQQWCFPRVSNTSSRSYSAPGNINQIRVENLTCFLMSPFVCMGWAQQEISI